MPDSSRQVRKPGSPADRLALGTGTAVLVPSAIAGHKVVLSARTKTGSRGHALQSTDILRLPKGVVRRRHAAGWLASRGAGGVGLGLASSGLYGMAQRRSSQSVADMTGGQMVHALHESAAPVRTGNRRRDVAVTAGSGLVGQGVASEAINRTVGRVGTSALPHWGRAVGSAAGAVGGLAGGRYILRRAARRDERHDERVAKSTDQAVRRRLNRNALAVQAAGNVPLVGDVVAAGKAYHAAPKEHRRRAAATVLGGNWGTQAASMTVGGLGGYHLGRRSATVARGSERIESALQDAKKAVRRGVGLSETPAARPRLEYVLRPAKAVARGLKLNTPAGAVGSMAAGMVGANVVQPRIYRRYQRRYEEPQLRRRMSASVSKTWRYEAPAEQIAKSDRPLTNRDVAAIHRGQRRQAKLSYTLAGMGAGATGLLVAGKTKKLVAVRRRPADYVKPVLSPGERLVNAATNLSIATGGVGALSSLNFARTQKLQARQKVQKVAADWRRMPMGSLPQDEMWFHELTERLTSREPGEWEGSRRDMRSAMKDWKKTNPHLVHEGQKALDASRYHRPYRVAEPKRKRRVSKRNSKDAAAAEWRDRRYQYLADPLYQPHTGMARVHRSTYPSTTFMREQGVGVNRRGEVFVGSSRLANPLDEAKARRASEHAANAQRHRHRAARYETQEKVGTTVGGLVGTSAASGLLLRGQFKQGHPLTWRIGRKALFPAAAGAAGSFLGGRLLRNEKGRTAETIREGRSRRYGQQALIQAAGFPADGAPRSVNKALFPARPRVTPVGAGRARGFVPGYTMRRRNPWTGRTTVTTVRGGMR